MIDTTAKSLKYTRTAEKSRVFSLNLVLRLAATLLTPTITLFTVEWIHRGTLSGFFTIFEKHPESFLLAWLFLLLLYIAVSRLTGRYPLATLTVCLLGNLPAAVTWFKLQLRGEPFLPWDISQAAEASNVMGKANLEMQPAMAWTIVIAVLLTALSFFVRVPRRSEAPRAFWRRMAAGAGATAALAFVVFGIYLRPVATEKLNIIPDMWMQNRYYRNYGVITGFMSNLQSLNIAKPEGYSAGAVQSLKTRIETNKPDRPLFFDSYAATLGKKEREPNIIYIMNEAFYDVEELPGIVFDQPVTPNLQRMKETAATGKSYSPSFGGGTCDVEFEALTGYSVEHLPAGCKPYQQHVTRDMFALPSYLKDQGYRTVAIHGYYRKYWSRDKAYPHLGIDTFIAADDFVNPEKKRSHYWKGGLISDAEMGRMIIDQFENKGEGEKLFIHAVTMQNHSSYNAENYPEEELVNIVSAPEGISEDTLSQLRDFATGIRENDAMLGALVDYFSQVEEPTILVFWGDHYNTVGKGYELYEKTGFIEPGDTKSPKLHATPLVIWSNYYQKPVDIGTVASYNITPVMMDLYGIKKPPMFDFLLQEMQVFRARTRGVTINPDGSTAQEMTAEQEQWFNDHWLLQYDQMFGSDYLNQPAKQT
ncbi:LTA synthase family protein [Anaerotruncus rubiinfantis]|uniref:LTA synthase family protein n=1 Tax=Anaerotruncus rubiinfantis TaxID=1720200 RepID=UPI0034A2211E